LNPIFATMLQKVVEPTQAMPVTNSVVDFDQVTEEVLSKSWLSDYLGMSGSVLCLIHCIAPQLIMLGSIGVGLGSFFASGWWHLGFWITCFLAVWQSSRVSVYSAVKVFLWASFLIFTAGVMYEWIADVENWVSYAGSFLLIVAHITNLIAQQKWNRWLSQSMKK